MLIRKLLFRVRLWLSLRTGAREIRMRPLRDREVALVAAMPGGRAAPLHRQRLALQRAGQVLYLVAWRGSLPIGHLLLWWAGTDNKPVSPTLAGSADLSDLYVVPAYRSRGIGTRLMDAAEAEVRRRGFTQLGLDVSTDNPRARVFYERRGYRDAGFGARTVYWTDADVHGAKQEVESVYVYLVKPLPPLQ